MIVYAPLWETMKRKGVSVRALRAKHGLSAGTVQRLKKGESVTMQTLGRLCRILDCGVDEIIIHVKEAGE